MSKAMGKKPTVRDILEQAIEEIVGKGVYWSEVCAEFEKLFIIRALKQSGGSVYKAADLMGIHRNTLSKKIREYKIDRSSLRRDSRKA